MTLAAPRRPVALIADDDEVMRVMLIEAVERAGMGAIAVSDGQSALNAALNTTFAMALLDVEMPAVDGYTVCRALRALRLARTLPIIMITGKDDANSVTRAYEAGATDFMAKPLNWPLMTHRLLYVQRNADIMRSLEQRESENQALIGSIPDTIYFMGADAMVRRVWNDSSLSTDIFFPAPLDRFLPAETARRATRDARATSNDGRSRHDEYTVAHPTGEEESYELRYFRCGSGEVLLVRQDVTSRKAAEKRIVQLAYFDTLTGLPNRQSFVDAVGAELTTADIENDGLTVACLNLDGITRISETFGHSVADEVVRTSAAQLVEAAKALRADGTALSVARLEGSQFGISIRSSECMSIVDRLVQSLSVMFREPVRCGQHDFFVRPSMGVAVFPEHGRDAVTLVKNANTAMFRTKETAAVDCLHYSDALSTRALERISLDAELRRAVVGDGLELHFQPKFRLADDLIVGLEALLRWRHPRLGYVQPSRFIPIAEETGLILDIGAWVTRAAFLQLSQWARMGLRVPIAINVSGKEFQHRSPAQIIAQEARHAGLAPSCLEVEITESVLMSDLTQVKTGLEQLRDLGCQIALDDFGTGYSSLAYLQRMPLDRLKIDRAFIERVHRNSADGAIVDAVINLAKSVNLSVLAEGVENEQQLEWLKRHGCHEAQGYFLGRPVPAAEIELLLSATSQSAAPPGNAVRTNQA